MSRRRPATEQDLCSCGTERAYAACCGRWHEGVAAPSAESLMRSRYSAYVLMLEPYLLETWHASTRPTSLDLAGEKDMTQWLGLRVLRADEQDTNHATVEFVARYRVGGGSAVRLHELSRFVREDGRWYYIDGMLQEPSAGR